MGTVLIAYDLNQPGQDYTDLYRAIKESGSAWWHHLDSTWLLKTGKSAKEIRDTLRGFVDSGDELLVIDVTRRARAWHGFTARGGKWLKETYA